MEKQELLTRVARELLSSNSNNGWGIKANAISEACNKYQVKWKDLWRAIIEEIKHLQQEEEPC
jgi:hypothetical protein